MLLFVLLPLELAAISSLIGGYLLLPSATSFDVPFLPPLDKSNIPAISTFILAWMKGTNVPPPRRSPLVYCLAIAFVISPLFTTLNNSYELQIADRSIPGFYPLDAVKLAIRNLFTLAPFFIGMRFISSDDSRALLLKALTVSALCYSVPIVFEARFSPQLHNWVYGFHPSDFIQQMRDGGYRPVVFLSHGLEVALYSATAVIAATVLLRARIRIVRMPGSLVAGYLGGILLISKSMASLIYAVVLAPLVLITRPKTWVRLACAISLVVCAYPLLRTYEIIPVHHILDAAAKVSVDRSDSLQTRVKNEDVLLAKANQKPFFGWGTWGRYRAYDAASGRDITVSDGEWIIQFGMFGWFGYLSLFGLFAASLFQARRIVRGPPTQSSVVLGGLALLLAVKLADLVPNSGLLPLTFLMGGSIAGCLRVTSARTSIRSEARQPAATLAPSH